MIESEPQHGFTGHPNVLALGQYFRCATGSRAAHRANRGAFALFALCAYGAMVVLGLSALAIGILVFAEVRQVDATLIGALAAVAFALPALRSALPGSPPLGVQADVWVFLWAELAVVLALGLVVFQWARAGPHP